MKGQVLDVRGTLELFAQANRFLAAEAYRIGIAAEKGRAVRMSSGLTLKADQPLFALAGEVDTLPVAGGAGVRSGWTAPSYHQDLERLHRPRDGLMASSTIGTLISGLEFRLEMIQDRMGPGVDLLLSPRDENLNKFRFEHWRQANA